MTTSGQVLDVLGDIAGRFEYDGDADVALPSILPADAGEVEARQGKAPCACTGVEVTLVCGKLTWDARACFAHGFLVYGLSPLYYQQED